MRKIRAAPIFVFAGLFLPATALGIWVPVALLRLLPLGDYRPIVTVGGAIAAIYAVNIAAYRTFLFFFPLREGETPEGSKAEFIYHVYVLYYLLLFNSLTPSLLIPAPLMRLIYLALGARLGANTYSAGAILDPPLVQIGANTIIGYDSVLCPHAVEGGRVVFSAIRIGDNVTIGMKAIIMAGVTIEDGAIIAAGSIVTKGARVGAGEMWGGAPARLLRAREASGLQTPVGTSAPGDPNPMSS